MNEKAVEIYRPRRVSIWKLIGIIAASLLIMLAVGFVWVSAAGNRRFAMMADKLRGMVVGIESRDPSRPVLRGVPVPGNAWNDYQLAIDEVRKIASNANVLREYVSRAPKGDRAKVEAHLSAHGVALDHLRRGASRAYGRFPYRWEESSTPAFYWPQSLADFAVCRARFLAEEGRPREAAELVLDLCQFARDFGFNGVLFTEMIALSIYGAAFEDLRDLLFSGELSSEDLAEVEREMELVDQSFPPHALSLINDSVFSAYNMIKVDSNPSEYSDIPILLRPFGGIRRLLFADSFDTWRGVRKRCADFEAKPWNEATKALAELSAETERFKNPFSVTLDSNWISRSTRAGRERRGQLRPPPRA